jgi:xylulokinase
VRILALDVGTSSVKAAVLDATTAAPVGPVARAAYPLDHPTPDAAEVPAERLWQAVTAAAREAVRGQEGIEAVGMACLTPALVLLDKADRPVTPIWTHLDRRSRPAARQVWAAVGEEFLATVGNRPLPGGITAICFRQQLAQDSYLTHQVRGYLHVNGWLGLRLTGEKRFDPANACFTGLYGTLTDQSWSPRWCDFFEVEPSWLPPVSDGRTTLGPLRSAAANELGVPAGIPVKLGTADTSSEILAAGMGLGDLLHTAGTTQVVVALTDRPRPDPRRLTRQLGVGTLFVHAAHHPVGGAALGWLHELCFRDQTEQEFYERTLPEAEKRATRVVLDPPFLGGDRLEIEAHRAAFRDLTLATDRLDLLAATLAALRLQHRKALAALGMGDQFRRIFLTGGAAEIVRQLIPEYAGAAVHLLEEGALRGVARLFTDPTDTSAGGCVDTGSVPG